MSDEEFVDLFGDSPDDFLLYDENNPFDFVVSYPSLGENTVIYDDGDTFSPFLINPTVFHPPPQNDDANERPLPLSFPLPDTNVPSSPRDEVVPDIIPTVNSAKETIIFLEPLTFRELAGQDITLGKTFGESAETILGGSVDTYGTRPLLLPIRIRSNTEFTVDELNHELYDNRLTPNMSQLLKFSSTSAMDYFLQAISIQKFILTNRSSGTSVVTELDIGLEGESKNQYLPIGPQYTLKLTDTNGGFVINDDTALYVIANSLYVTPYEVTFRRNETGPYLCMSDLIQAAIREAFDVRSNTALRLKQLGLVQDEEGVTLDDPTLNQKIIGLSFAHLSCQIAIGNTSPTIQFVQHTQAEGRAWYSASKIILASSANIINMTSFPKYARKWDLTPNDLCFINIIRLFRAVLETMDDDALPPKEWIQKMLGSKLYFQSPLFAMGKYETSALRQLFTMKMSTELFVPLIKRLFKGDAEDAVDQRPYVNLAPSREPYLMVTGIVYETYTIRVNTAWGNEQDVDHNMAFYRAAKLMLVAGAYMETLHGHVGFDDRLKKEAQYVFTESNGLMTDPIQSYSDIIQYEKSDNDNDKEKKITRAFTDLESPASSKNLIYLRGIAQWRGLNTIDHVRTEYIPAVVLKNIGKSGFNMTFRRAMAKNAIRINTIMRSPETLRITKIIQLPQFLEGIAYVERYVMKTRDIRDSINQLRAFVLDTRTAWVMNLARGQLVDKDDLPFEVATNMIYLFNEHIDKLEFVTFLCKTFDIVLRHEHLENFDKPSKNALRNLLKTHIGPPTQGTMLTMPERAFPFHRLTDQYFPPERKSSIAFAMPTAEEVKKKIYVPFQFGNDKWTNHDDQVLRWGCYDTWLGTIDQTTRLFFGRVDAKYTAPVYNWIGPRTETIFPPLYDDESTTRHVWSGAAMRGQQHLFADYLIEKQLRNGEDEEPVDININMSETGFLTLRRAMLTTTISVVPMMDRFFANTMRKTRQANETVVKGDEEEDEYSLHEDVARLYGNLMLSSNYRLPSAMNILVCDLFALAMSIHGSDSNKILLSAPNEKTALRRIVDDYIGLYFEPVLGNDTNVAAHKSPVLYVPNVLVPKNDSNTILNLTDAMQKMSPFKEEEEEDDLGAKIQEIQTSIVTSGLGEIRHFFASTMVDVIDKYRWVFPPNENTTVIDELIACSWPILHEGTSEKLSDLFTVPEIPVPSARIDGADLLDSVESPSPSSPQRQGMKRPRDASENEVERPAKRSRDDAFSDGPRIDNVHPELSQNLPESPVDSQDFINFST